MSVVLKEIPSIGLDTMSYCNILIFETIVIKIDTLGNYGSKFDQKNTCVCYGTNPPHHDSLLLKLRLNIGFLVLPIDKFIRKKCV